MELYSADWCTQCTPVKQLIKDNEWPVAIVDVDTPEGADKASASGVRGLPTLRVDDTSIVGADKITAALRGAHE